MKAIIAILASSFILGMSSIALASDGGCGSGGCGSDACDPYQSDCQCTDPICNKPWYSDCISRSYCCEAFGNIGAR